MLEKPNLDDGLIGQCLREDYGLDVVGVAFLPLGADRDTAVYRAVTGDATPYFVKLRRGAFDQTAVVVPRLLSDQGVRQIIPPLATRSGQLWAHLRDFTVTLSPYVEGRNGYERALSKRHWIELGRALKGIHTAALPSAVADSIPRETFSRRWRDSVTLFLARAESEIFSDPVAAELAALLRAKRQEVDNLVRHADRLATVLLTRSPEYVVCHADIHAGNVLIDRNDTLHIVDWDTLTLAPRERDLMFVGGGQFGGSRAAAQEEQLFYQGYGQTQADPVALAYYRCERIVQDIAAYCQQILLTDEGGADRAEGLQQLSGQFVPDNVVAIALSSVKRLPLAGD